MKKEALDGVPNAHETANALPKKTKKKAPKKTDLIPTDLTHGELEELIVSLSNQGRTMSEIGKLLQEQHNVPKTKLVLNKTISQVLAEHALSPEIPEDLLALIRKVVALDSHLQKNKKDFSAKRGYQITTSKIRRLVTYYHQTNRLPAKWHYSIETARLLVR